MRQRTETGTVGVRGGSGYKNIQETELTNSNDREMGGVGEDRLQGSRMGSAAHNCLCTRTVNRKSIERGGQG